MHWFKFIFSCCLTLFAFHLYSQEMLLKSKDFDMILSDFKKSESFKFAHSDLSKKDLNKARMWNHFMQILNSWIL